MCHVMLRLARPLSTVLLLYLMLPSLLALPYSTYSDTEGLLPEADDVDEENYLLEPRNFNHKSLLEAALLRASLLASSQNFPGAIVQRKRRQKARNPPRNPPCKPPKRIMCHDGGLMGVWARLVTNPKYSD